MTPLKDMTNAELRDLADLCDARIRDLDARELDETDRENRAIIIRLRNRADDELWSRGF